MKVIDTKTLHASNDDDGDILFWDPTQLCEACQKLQSAYRSKNPFKRIRAKWIWTGHMLETKKARDNEAKEEAAREFKRLNSPLKLNRFEWAGDFSSQAAKRQLMMEGPKPFF